MPAIPKRPQTEDSTNFDPDQFFDAWAKEEATALYENNFRKFIIKSFGLPFNDDYGYQAVSEVTLLQLQTYIEFGAQGGLHAWYKDGEGQTRPPPSATDVAAYTDIFRPTTSTAKALTALAANARKESIRAEVARHLQGLYQPPAPEHKLLVGRHKAHINPSFDVWAWSNQNLEWAGPEANTVAVKTAHPLLPVVYHHFGCVCPSYEALVLIQQLARGRAVLDMGSGNGYWTYMLRRMEPVSKKEKRVHVVPIDNGVSEWRTMWIGDTIETDGEQWLKTNQGGRDAVLLMVYPVVGNEFTSKMIRAYQGSTIIAAGSQNANGFTAFAKETLADWMTREMPTWDKILQIPLPSFAGKDEALFVFEKADDRATASG